MAMVATSKVTFLVPMVPVMVSEIPDGRLTLVIFL